MEKAKVWVLTHGLTKKFIRANGLEDLSMGLEFGEEEKEILTSESGTEEKQMATVFTLGKMVNEIF